MKFSIKNYLSYHLQVQERLDLKSIENFIKVLEQAYKGNKKIFVCGNGGSAHTASHLITDWNKMIYLSKKKKFRGISLCDNLGLITAFSNDLSYEKIFEGQLNSIFEKGDVVIGISVSGNSKNVLNAIKFCNKNKGVSMSFTGFNGGKLKKISKFNIHIPSFDMQVCEDFHLMLGHIIMKNFCDYDIK